MDFAYEKTIGLMRTITVARLCLTDVSLQELKNIEHISLDAATTIFNVNTTTGDLLINNKVLNQYYDGKTVRLPEALSSTNKAFIVPTESVQLFRLKDTTSSAQKFTLSGVPINSSITARLITEPVAAPVLLSLDNITFTQFIYITNKLTDIWIKLTPGQSLQLGTRFEFILTAITVV